MENNILAALNFKYNIELQFSNKDGSFDYNKINEPGKLIFLKHNDYVLLKLESGQITILSSRSIVSINLDVKGE